MSIKKKLLCREVQLKPFWNLLFFQVQMLLIFSGVKPHPQNANFFKTDKSVGFGGTAQLACC